MTSTERLRTLVEMSRMASRPENDLVILGEGNTSAREEDGSFWIKASGTSLCEIAATGFVRVTSEPVMAALDGPVRTDLELRELLNGSRTDPSATNYPSTETFMHAYLLSLEGINFVVHTHPTPVLALMCSPLAEDFAHKRLFPDQIVLCGANSVLVPYVAPGLKLAQAIRCGIERFGAIPRTILLRNHGLITIGRTPSEALAATTMCVKAAKALLLAAQTGTRPVFLTDEEVRHIDTWQDEHFRQKQIFGG